MKSCVALWSWLCFWHTHSCGNGDWIVQKRSNAEKIIMRQSQWVTLLFLQFRVCLSVINQVWFSAAPRLVVSEDLMILTSHFPTFTPHPPPKITQKLQSMDWKTLILGTSTGVCSIIKIYYIFEVVTNF